jgi:hypothetical protein
MASALAMGCAFGFGSTSATAQPSGRAEVDVCLDAHEQAQVLEKAGRLLDAREQLRSCSKASCPALVQQDCVPWLAEIERTIPTVAFEASDDGEPVLDVRVTVDGREVTRRLEGQTLSLDPGVHSFRFERPQRSAIEQELAVNPGEKNRLVGVAFRSPPPLPKPASTSIGEYRPIPPLVWALGGLSLVAAATTASLGAWALSERANLASSCAPFCSSSRISSLETKVALTDVASAVALGAALGTVYVYLTRPAVPGGRISYLGVSSLPLGVGAKLAGTF